MNSYHVTFFKRIGNSSGRSFKCPQASFDIVSRDPEEAMKAASRQFANAHQVSDWKSLADSFAVDLVPAEAVGA